MQSLGSRESRKSKALKIVVVVGVLFIIARTALDAFDMTPGELTSANFQRHLTNFFRSSTQTGLFFIWDRKPPV